MKPTHSLSSQTRTSGMTPPGMIHQKSTMDVEMEEAKENLETAKRNLKVGQKELRSAEYERKAYLRNQPTAIRPVELEDINRVVFSKADVLHLLENRHRIAELKLQALQAKAASGASGSQSVPEFSGAILPINLNRTPHPPAVSKTGRIAPGFFVPNHSPFDTHLGPTGKDLEKIKANISKHQAEVDSAQQLLDQEFKSFATALVKRAEQGLEQAKSDLEIAKGKASDGKMEMQDAIAGRKAFMTLTEAHLEARESELHRAHALADNPIPSDMDGLSEEVIAAKSRLETARRDLRASRYQERNFHEANDKYFGKP